MQKNNIIYIFFILSFISICTVSASATRIYVDPPSTTGYNPGQTFNVNIKVDDFTNLYGFQLKLGYDTNILEAQQIQIDFLNEPRFWVTQNKWDQNDFVWISITSLTPTEPLTGDGTLARINFRVKGSGMSALDLHNTKLRDNTVTRISHSVSDGYFSNIPVTCLTDGSGAGTDGKCYIACGAAVECSGAEPGEANTCCGIEAQGCYFTDITGYIERGVPDGKVDMRDVSMASKAFGSYPGHELWNPLADINGDEKVDMRDISAVSKKFGTTCEVTTQPLGFLDSLVQFFRNFFGRFLLVMR